MEHFVLFGDSITEKGGCQSMGYGFTLAVQEAYIRRLDVINRGLSGYNTDQALIVLPRIFPRPEQNHVRLMTIWFGANDAALPDLPGPKQTVPLEEFKSNLLKLATHELVTAHRPKLILITPPPIDERLSLKVSQGYGFNVLFRTAENTARYAEAVRQVGQQLSLPVLDVWTIFLNLAGMEPGKPLPGSLDAPYNEVLVRLLSDGLHLTGEGYGVVYKEFMELLNKEYPEESPERLPFVLPGWADEEGWKRFHRAQSAAD